MGDPGIAATYVFVFRIAERMAISLVVVLLAVVVSVAFWRSLQRIDFQLSREKLSGGGTVVLATPLFALLALIGFAYVSFSNPVSVSLPARAAPAADEAAPERQASAGGIEVIGSGAASGPAAADAEARQRLLSLNCIAAAAEGLRPRDADVLVGLRLAALGALWRAEWGDFAAFRAWATGAGGAAPHPDARRLFEETHLRC